MKVQIKNFRSIIDSGSIEINDLNILLGKNSSGKSSFLRLFPMFKESCKNELKGPFLWFDENYDFGSFSNALSRHAKEDKDCITFSFNWQETSRSRKSEILYFSMIVGQYINNVDLEMSIAKRGDYAFLNRLIIHIVSKTEKESTITISDEGGDSGLRVCINDRPLSISETLSWQYATKSFLPTLSINNGETNVYALVSKVLDKHAKNFENRDFRHYSYYVDGLSFDKDGLLKDLDVAKDPSVMDYLLRVDPQDLFDAMYLKNVSSLLEYVSDYLTRYFTHCYYITPLRYNFLRYMRNRDLSVDYVESTGKNVMEYILSLNATEKREYKQFILETLGVEVDVMGEDNKSIVITNSDNEEDNIVDVGYGFSQVLPIATTLWDRAYKRDKRYGDEVGSTIVIEQPEVHLHPFMQGELAKLFVNALKLANTKKNKLSIIVETHSSVLVNRIGKYIYNKKLISEGINDYANEPTINNDRVSLYLFEKNQGCTTVVKTSYSEEGRVMKWPAGFLD